MPETLQTKPFNPSFPDSAKEILKQNSPEAKKRETQTINWKEAEEILNKILVKSHLNEVEVFKAIGLSPSSFYDGKRNGECRLVTKLALEGYLAQIETKNDFKLEFPQLALIFTSLLFYQAHISDTQILKQIQILQTTLAKLMSNSTSP